MSLPSVKIRNIPITPGLVLAPMSGVTNVAFRRLIRSLNPGALGMVVTEFISVEALTRQVARSFQMMRYYEEERPVAVQIFGYDIGRMREAALMVEGCGADIVDINCGCPAPKVVKKGGGCELMRQPRHLAALLREIRKSVSIPLTMKFRSGWDEGSLNALEVAKIAEGEGVEALAVHGRTRAQLYRGDADWEVVRAVAHSVKIPVFGSGDVADIESARARLFPGIAGLYVGRAALKNPFIFAEIAAGHPVDWKKDEALVLGVLNKYITFLLADFAPRHCVGRIKQLTSQMCRGHAWSKDLCRAMQFEEQLSILQRAAEGGNAARIGNCGIHGAS